MENGKLCQTITGEMSGKQPMTLWIICFLGLALSCSKHTAVSADTLRTGRQFWYNTTGIPGFNCMKCHPDQAPDTFSFYPDREELSHKYQNLSSGDLRDIFIMPPSELAAACHDTFALPDSAFEFLFTFLSVPGKNNSAKKVVIAPFWIIVFCGIVSALLIVTGTRLKACPQIRFFVGFSGLTGTLIFFFLLYRYITALGLYPGYTPVQPVKFSHKTHCEQNKTDCYYCHSGAYQARFAGIPSTSICMNCHLVVQEGSQSGAWEIRKITCAYQKREPIQWQRVHNLPAHVVFRHDIHCSAARITCLSCHPQADRSNCLSNGAGFSMGTCISCHRESVVKDNYGREIPYRTKGGLDCIKCHH